jgi:hypothetical protein
MYLNLRLIEVPAVSRVINSYLTYLLCSRIGSAPFVDFCYDPAVTSRGTYKSPPSLDVNKEKLPN